MKSFKENYIDNVNEINKVLAYCRYKELVDSPEHVGTYTYYINFERIEFRVYAKTNTALPQCYIFRMDGSKASEHKTTGKKAFSQLQKMSDNFVVDYSTFDYNGILWKYWDCVKGKPIWECGYRKAMLYFNKKYNGKRVQNCISYDANSAYSYAMTKDMPDVRLGFRKCELENRDSIVKKDEIGFVSDCGELLMVKTGFHAEYIFKRVKSPFIKFVNHYYDLKKNAKNKVERQAYKDYLTYAVGYILRKNPFLHCAIMCYAREEIENLMDENTLYSNTDSIVSCVRRLDIEERLGTELGQFKIDHKGDFAMLNGAFQWNYDTPSYRGLSKEWFKKDFDLLKDNIPNKDCNKYIYNEQTKFIELNTKKC